MISKFILSAVLDAGKDPLPIGTGVKIADGGAWLGRALAIKAFNTVRNATVRLVGPGMHPGWRGGLRDAVCYLSSEADGFPIPPSVKWSPNFGDIKAERPWAGCPFWVADPYKGVHILRDVDTHKLLRVSPLPPARCASSPGAMPFYLPLNRALITAPGEDEEYPEVEVPHALWRDPANAAGTLPGPYTAGLYFCWAPPSESSLRKEGGQWDRVPGSFWWHSDGPEEEAVMASEEWEPEADLAEYRRQLLVLERELQVATNPGRIDAIRCRLTALDAEITAMGRPHLQDLQQIREEMLAHGSYRGHPAPP